MSKLLINLTKISDNLSKTKALCEKNNLGLLVVTKCCGGDPVVLRHVVEAGAVSIGGTHPQHFEKINGAEKTLLIVLPSYPDMLSRCDYAYVTELETLEKISKSPESNRVGIIIPLDFGDLREGVPPWEILSFMKNALKLPTLRIKGFSSNFGCLTESPPKPGVLEMFAQSVSEIRNQTGYQPEIVSIGGSVLWKYLENGNIPRTINQIRVGGAIFLGSDPGLPEPMTGFHRDAFILEGQIIEIREKRLVGYEFSQFWNDKSNNGTNVNQKERARKRAVLDFGYTACCLPGLIPMNKDIEVVGASQDLTVIDVTNSGSHLSVGDGVKFIMNYKSLAMAMICPYLKKTYVK